MLHLVRIVLFKRPTFLLYQCRMNLLLQLEKREEKDMHAYDVWAATAIVVNSNADDDDEENKNMKILQLLSRYYIIK